MSIEYRELASENDFLQVSEFQRRVFGLSDLELISPLQLALVARNNPPMGIHLGVFSAEAGRSEMIGAILGFATFLEKSVYTVLVGIFPEFQKRGHGRNLLLQYREVCLSRGIQVVYGVFDPLDVKLARLYIGSLGFIGQEYLGTKLLFRWDLLSDHTFQKLGKKSHLPIQEFPIASGSSRPEGPLVLFELPPDYPDLKAAGSPKAEEYLEESRLVLSDYLNRRKYTVTDCCYLNSGDLRRYHFVLKNPD